MTYVEDKSATITAASHWPTAHVTSVPLVVSAFSQLGPSRENPKTTASIKYNNYYLSFLIYVGCLVSVAGVLAFTFYCTNFASKRLSHIVSVSQNIPFLCSLVLIQSELVAQLVE